MSITQPVCVCVCVCVCVRARARAYIYIFETLGIGHALSMPHIVICGLPHSTIFFYIISQKHDIRVGGKLRITKYAFFPL